MTTTHRVKMAKASQADIDSVIELYQMLNAIEDCRPASDAVDEFEYKGYEGCETDLDYLVRASRKGGLFRVAFGMQVLVDARNEIVDPNVNHLELHPKIRAAMEFLELGKRGRIEQSPAPDQPKEVL